jgi:predicted transcriptional regulator
MYSLKYISKQYSNCKIVNSFYKPNQTKRIMKKTGVKIGVKVGDIMTRNFISAKPDISVLDAAKLMTKKRVGSLILENKGFLKGIITEKDIIWAMIKK